MNIINSKEIDTFLWEHRDNICVGVEGSLVDEDGLSLNTAWRDSATGEEIEVKYTDA